MGGEAQVFLALVLVNIVGGAVFAYEWLIPRLNFLQEFLKFLRKPVPFTILGFILILVGLIALFTFHFTQPFFLADLFPSLSAIVGGVCALLPEAPSRIKETRIYSIFLSFFTGKDTILGLTLITLGFVHFILRDLTLL